MRRLFFVLAWLLLVACGGSVDVGDGDEGSQSAGAPDASAGTGAGACSDCERFYRGGFSALKDRPACSAEDVALHRAIIDCACRPGVCFDICGGDPGGYCSASSQGSATRGPCSDCILDRCAAEVEACGVELE